MHPFNFSCIVENAKLENAIVIIINYELHESPKWQTYFPFKTVELKKSLIVCITGYTVVYRLSLSNF